MKGFCLDQGGACQSEPEGYHSCYSPENAPPAQPPLDCAGVHSHDCHLLFQGFESLTNVVHAVHVITLLRLVHDNLPSSMEPLKKKSARRSIRCAGDGPHALSVSVLRVRLVQDRLSGVLQASAVRENERHPIPHTLLCQQKICNSLIGKPLV